MDRANVYEQEDFDADLNLCRKKPCTYGALNPKSCLLSFEVCHQYTGIRMHEE